MRENHDGIITEEWGAITETVSFTIRNAEIESVESEYTDSGNIMLSTANGEKYWDDNIGVTLVNEPEDYKVHRRYNIPDNTFFIPSHKLM